MTQSDDGTPFADAPALGAWLAAHHATAPHLWVRLYKKGSGIPSVSWDDCVIQSIAWGWIDSLKRPRDDISWLQRLSPRKPGSAWSDRNRAHADRLIAAGLMQAPGLAHVAQARADGRWDNAYAGAAQMEIPADFLAAVAADPAAQATFATLDRTNLYAIYYRLHTAKTARTRAARFDRLLATLARGERFH